MRGQTKVGRLRNEICARVMRNDCRGGLWKSVREFQGLKIKWLKVISRAAMKKVIKKFA